MTFWPILWECMKIVIDGNYNGKCGWKWKSTIHHAVELWAQDNHQKYFDAYNLTDDSQESK